MKNRPSILITNDDGIHAPGIKHLWKALSTIADVIVVAPAYEQSAVGLSITIRHPLKIEKVEWHFAPKANLWSVNGTPADCVKLALTVIMQTKPDLIISGINRGSNAGRNILYSGTVAAVIEGTLHNIQGVAFSIADFINPEYEKAEKLIPKFIDYILNHPLPTGTFLNVNFPKGMANLFNGIRFAKQGLEYWAENPEARDHPAEGSPYYWLGAKIAQFDEHQDCDIHLLKEGFVTAVPIHIQDLTHHKHFEEHRVAFENIVNKEAGSSIRFEEIYDRVNEVPSPGIFP